MIAVDSSVAIAAFASWHQRHAVAHRSVARRPHLPSHAALEVYSVLTRLPAPYRVASAEVAEWLDDTFADRLLTLDGEGARQVPVILSEAHIQGGAAYDGLVAVLAKSAGATLLSLDVRASRTYRRLGVDHELLG